MGLSVGGIDISGNAVKSSGSSGVGGDWLGGALAAAPALMQGIQGLSQRNKAKRLKQSDFDFMPLGLKENKALSQQQAYSRRAPGAAQAEENIRRNQANTIAAAQRMYGGDTNKMAAIASGANVHANDAVKQVATLGQQFSENAFNRLQQSNNAMAGQQRQNYTDYWKTKSALLYASDQNIFNAINNASSAGLAYLSGKKGNSWMGNAGQYQNQQQNYYGYPPNYNPYQQAPRMASPYNN